MKSSSDALPDVNITIKKANRNILKKFRIFQWIFQWLILMKGFWFRTHKLRNLQPNISNFLDDSCPVLSTTSRHAIPTETIDLEGLVCLLGDDGSERARSCATRMVDFINYQGIILRVFWRMCNFFFRFHKTGVIFPHPLICTYSFRFSTHHFYTIIFALNVN